MTLSQDNPIFKHKTFVELLDDKQFGFTDKKRAELKAKFLTVIGSLDVAREELEKVKLSESDLKKIRDFQIPEMSKNEVKQIRDTIKKETKKINKQLLSNSEENANPNQQLIQTGGDLYGVAGYLKRLAVNLLVTYIFYSLSGASLEAIGSACDTLIEILESFSPQFESFFLIPLLAIRSIRGILGSEVVSSGVEVVLNSLTRLINFSLFPAGILTSALSATSLIEYIKDRLGNSEQQRTLLNTIGNNLVITINGLYNYFTTPERIDADVEETQSIISGLGNVVKDYARRGANIVTSIVSGVWQLTSYIRQPATYSLDFVITLVNNYFDSIYLAYQGGDINLDILTGGAMLISLCGFTFLYGSSYSLGMTSLITGFLRFDLSDPSGIIRPIIRSISNNLNTERRRELDAAMTPQRLQGELIEDAREMPPLEQRRIMSEVARIYQEARDDPFVQGATGVAAQVGNIGMSGIRTVRDTLGTGIAPAMGQFSGLVPPPGRDATRPVPYIFSEEAFPTHGEGSSAEATALGLDRTDSEHSISSARTEPYPPGDQMSGTSSSLNLEAIGEARRKSGLQGIRVRPLLGKRERSQQEQPQYPPLPPGPLPDIPPPPQEESSRSPSQTPPRRRRRTGPSPSPSRTPSQTPSPGTLERMDSGSSSEDGEVDAPMPELQRGRTLRRRNPRRGGARKTRKCRKVRKARKTRKSTKVRKAHKARKVNKARKTRKSTKARKARKTRKSRK